MSPADTAVAGAPGPTLPEEHAADVRTAARALLARPLMTERDEAFGLVRRHRDALERFFADGLGYRLVVEPRTARLVKAGLGPDSTRGLRRRTGQGRPFEPRAYALLCLSLAALTRCPDQLLVDELVAAVRSAAADAALPVDLDGIADRRALAASLRTLVDLGVLLERDGDLERWADSPVGEATSLLDVRRDRLRLMLLGGLAGARDPSDLLEVTATPSAAGGARVAVRRRLVESPLLSTGDLSEDQQEWWRRNRNREVDWFRDRLGLELELRAEGALAVDPDDELTDVVFPGSGSARHAALLVLERLVDAVRDDAREATADARATWPVTDAQLDTALAEVLSERGHAFRKAYSDAAVARAEVLDVLAGTGLLRLGAQGFDLHAAAARYAPQVRDERLF